MLSSRNQSSRAPTLPETNVASDSVLAAAAVSLEYASLRHSGHCPLGMYVVPSSANILVWDVVLFVHQGYYADSILKFRLIFPSDYPESPPSVQFMTEVFHPLISQQGSLNLASRFRPWRPKEHHVFDVLHYIKSAFKKAALDRLEEGDCFNREAYRLYHESTPSFASLATQTASLSQSETSLFDLKHPSQTNHISSEIEFSKLDKQQLQVERSNLGLQIWDKS